MAEQLSIYLAGKIQKEHEEPNETFWSLQDLEALRKALPEQELFFLNPATRSDNLADQKSVFGRDLTQVYLADIFFVDARDRRGLGVGAEMMWAKVHSKPVITLAPQDTHYRKTKTHVLNVEVANWVHPFVENLSDAIVSNIEEGAEWIRYYLEQSPPIRTPESIQEAMDYYLKAQLPHDEPMKELLMAMESQTISTSIAT